MPGIWRPFKSKKNDNNSSTSVDPEAGAKAAHGLGLANESHNHGGSQAGATPPPHIKWGPQADLDRLKSGGPHPAPNPEAGAKAAHGLGLANESHNHGGSQAGATPSPHIKWGPQADLDRLKSGGPHPAPNPEAGAKAAHGLGLAADAHHHNEPVYPTGPAATSPAHTGLGGGFGGNGHDTSPQPVAHIPATSPAHPTVAAPAGHSGATTDHPKFDTTLLVDNDGHSYTVKGNPDNYKIGANGNLLEKKGDGSGWYVAQKADDSTPPAAAKPIANSHAHTGVGGGFGGDGSDVAPTPAWSQDVNRGTSISNHGTTLASRDSKDGSKTIFQMSDGTYQTDDKATGNYAGSAGTWGDGQGHGVAVNGIGDPTPAKTTTTTSSPDNTDPMALVNGIYQPGNNQTPQGSSEHRILAAAKAVVDGGPPVVVGATSTGNAPANNTYTVGGQQYQNGVPVWNPNNPAQDTPKVSGHGSALASRDSKDGTKSIVQMSDGTYQSIDKVTGAVAGAGTWGNGQGGGVAVNGIGNPTTTTTSQVAPTATAWVDPVKPSPNEVSATNGLALFGDGGPKPGAGKTGHTLGHRLDLE